MIDQTYENCKGTLGLANDVQVFGNEETTYDRIGMKQWNALEKQALNLILINV